jgi:hypothetical protein
MYIMYKTSNGHLQTIPEIPEIDCIEITTQIKRTTLLRRTNILPHLAQLILRRSPSLPTVSRVMHRPTAISNSALSPNPHDGSIHTLSTPASYSPHAAPHHSAPPNTATLPPWRAASPAPRPAGCALHCGWRLLVLLEIGSVRRGERQRTPCTRAACSRCFRRRVPCRILWIGLSWWLVVAFWISDVGSSFGDRYDLLMF